MDKLTAVSADTGPDVGGAGVRVFSQYNNAPVYVVNTTFGGEEGLGNACSNGGGVSSIGVSWTLCGTRIESNEVVQHGSAIFFVTNDHSGDVRIDSSNLSNNLGGSWYPTYDQISGHDDTPIVVSNSVIGDMTID